MFKRPIFYGWYLLAAGILINLVIIGMTVSAFALYVIPVSKDLGLSRATMNTALILMNVGMACWGLFMGRLIDKWPLRPIVMGCGMLAGGSMIALGLSNSVTLNAAILLVPMSIGTVGGCTLSISVMLARWFTVHRGRVFALWALGMSLSNITTVPAIAYVIENFGWRTAVIGSGLIMAVLMFLLALLIRDRPGLSDIEPGSERLKTRAPVQTHGGGAPLSMRQIARIPEFWMIALGVGTGIGVMTAFVISAVPFATDLGYSLVVAGSLISFKGVAAIIGKSSLAVFADRVDRSMVLIFLFILLAAANIILLIDHSFATLATGCIMVGFVIGGAVPAYQALVADRFGTISLGTVRGMMAAITATLSACSLRFGGEVYDRTGDYALMFATFAVAAAIASLLIVGIRFLPPHIVVQPAAKPVAA